MVKYYAAVKKNGVALSVGLWNRLHDTLLRENSKEQDSVSSERQVCVHTCARLVPVHGFSLSKETQRK